MALFLVNVHPLLGVRGWSSLFKDHLGNPGSTRLDSARLLQVTAQKPCRSKEAWLSKAPKQDDVAKARFGTCKILLSLNLLCLCRLLCMLSKYVTL